MCIDDGFSQIWSQCDQVRASCTQNTLVYIILFISFLVRMCYAKSVGSMGFLIDICIRSGNFVYLRIMLREKLLHVGVVKCLLVFSDPVTYVHMYVYF